MKKLLLTIAICIFSFCLYAQKKEINWFENFAKAKEVAKNENKPILIFFHGSNWCPPCMKMQKEVFANDTFINELSSKIIFLDIDFRTKPKLSEAQLAHNKDIKKRFGLPEDFTQGYPQVVVINSKEEVLYKEKGYDGNGPAYLIEKVKSLQ